MLNRTSVCFQIRARNNASMSGAWHSALHVHGAGGAPRQAQVLGVFRCMVSEGV